MDGVLSQGILIGTEAVFLLYLLMIIFPSASRIRRVMYLAEVELLDNLLIIIISILLDV